MKKHPCRICRRWFIPNPRVGDRQKTCGDPFCQREWHRKKCARWNKENSGYFRCNYLDKKLELVKGSQGESGSLKAKSGRISVLNSRFKTGLPQGRVQEVIGAQGLVIIEYLAQLLRKRFQEVIRVQHVVNTKEIGQLPVQGVQEAMDSQLDFTL